MKTIKNILPFLAIASLGLVACGDSDAVSGDEQNVRETIKGGELEIYKSAKDDQMRFRLKGANGEKLLASEGYTSRDGADNGVKALLANGRDAANFQVKKAKNGKYMFNLLSADNGQVIATSETYSSKSKAQTGAKTARGYILGAPKTDDWTDQCGLELYEDGAKEMRFRLTAGNGEIILKSESYGSESAAKDGIDAVITYGSEATYFEVLDSADGGFYFNVVANNHEIVATSSETYTSEAAAEDGVDAVVALLAPQQDCFTRDLAE